jgi:hypothetical protein
MFVTGDTVRHGRFRTGWNKAQGRTAFVYFIVDGPAIKEKS